MSTSIVQNPSLAGPNMKFGNGVPNGFFTTSAPLAMPQSSWKVMQWHKAQYMDPSAMTARDTAASADQSDNMLYQWTTPSHESELNVYQGTPGTYIYGLVSRGGALGSDGGANVFLRSDAAPKTTFSSEILYSIDTKVSLAEISYDNPSASHRSVVAQAFTGFTLTFNKPGAVGYSTALPTINLFMQIYLTDSRFGDAGATYRSAVTTTGWNGAKLVSNILLPEDQALAFAADSGPLHHLTYSLNTHLFDIVTNTVWPTMDGRNAGALPASTQNLSLWSLNTMYVGVETQNSDSASAPGIPQGTVALGLDVANISVQSTAPQTRTGGVQNDTLIGAAGADTLKGGAGDDTYVVNSTGQTVVELANGGNDSISTALATYSLPSNVENLRYTGSKTFTGFGNALPNSLVGGNGRDTLDGDTGADTMNGGADNDTYFVDNSADTIVELAGGGLDLVFASVTFVLPDWVEQLTLTGAQNSLGTGNNLSNTIWGNTGNNELSGADGNDTLDGGAGADTLLGGAGNDSLIGGIDNDTLDGGSGVDTLAGGAGDDTYLVDNNADAIVELVSGGVDQVLASTNFVLPDWVERLDLMGTDNLSGGGNSLDNVIYGNAGNNALSGNGGNDMVFGGLGDDTLDGGTGTDTLVGGAGDDTYVVESSDDSIVELANGGADLVLASMSFELPSEVEHLTLLGIENLSGTGNSSANTIFGNSGNNLLSGGDGHDVIRGGQGNDTLIGGSGADQLTGGTGNDAFRFLTPTDGPDKILDFSHGHDKIEFSAFGFGGGLTEGMNVGASERLVAGISATREFGQIIYYQPKGTLLWDADGTGPGLPIWMGTLTGSPHVTAIDIAIVH